MELTSGNNPASDNLNNLEGLIQQISLNRCCAFVGAGLSHGACYPLWDEVVNHLRYTAEVIVDHQIDATPEPNWDQIETLRNLMGEDRYRNELIKLFGPDGKLDFLPVHYKICSIPFLSWITTNYDYCLENAAIAASKKVTVQYYPELDITRLRESHIFHIHGIVSPNHPEALIGSVILSKRDYETAYQPNTCLPRFLASLSEFCTLVFLGYSLGDSDLIKVIRTTQMELEQRGKFEFQIGLGIRRQPKHYILMHQEAHVDPEAVLDLGLVPIYYGGDKVNHSELQKLLESIRKRTTGIIYPEPVVYRDMFEDGYHG